MNVAQQASSETPVNAGGATDILPEVRAYDGPEGDDALGNEAAVAVLPRFGPPRAQVVIPEAKAEAKTALDVVAGPQDDKAPVAGAGEEQPAAAADAASTLPASEVAQDNPSSAPEPEAVDEEAANKGLEAENVADEPDPLDALRKVVATVMAGRAPEVTGDITDAELAAVAKQIGFGVNGSALRATQAAPEAARVPVQGAPAETMANVSGGHRSQAQGATGLVDGVMQAGGGLMALGGTIGQAVGMAANGVAKLGRKAMERGTHDQQSVMNVASTVSAEQITTVLPRLSDYRVAAVEKSVHAFESEQDLFWKSSHDMSVVRSEMKRRAQELGVSVEDIAQKMKPDGEFADLRKQFNEAVAKNPDSGPRRREMDKAFDSYLHQYNRAQTEVLNPDQADDPRYKKMREELDKNHARMKNSVGELPAFANENGVLEKTHLERLREAITAIIEKLKEVAQRVLSALSGKGGGDNEPGA